MNKREFLKMKIPRCKLDEMTVDTALEYVILEPDYQKHSYNNNIVTVNFQSEKGYDASLYITTEKQKED